MQIHNSLLTPNPFIPLDLDYPTLITNNSVPISQNYDSFHIAELTSAEGSASIPSIPQPQPILRKSQRTKRTLTFL